jgi:hypothetical protein
VAYLLIVFIGSKEITGLPIFVKSDKKAKIEVQDSPKESINDFEIKHWYTIPRAEAEERPKRKS